MSIMGIDLSTQSCTVEVRSEDGFAVLATARRPLPFTRPPVSEQDVRDWWDALVACMGDLASAGASLDGVRAVSVSGQCHGLVPLDASGRAIRPVKLWNDTTGSPQMEQLLERFGPSYWIEHTGSRPTAAFTIAKLAWLAEHEPDTIARIRHILLPHDYMTYRLTGEFVTDRSEASGTGWFDSVGNDYDYGLLSDCFGDLLDFRSVLPRVGAPEDAAGVLRADVARELGLTAGIPVGVGGGDQHMSAVGLGITPGDVVVSLGTSGVVYTTWTSPVRDLSGWVNGVADAAGGWLPLVCTLNCTKVTNWMARMLGVSVRQLDELAAEGDMRRAPVMAAYLDGERSPSLPLARGAVAGISNDTGREDLALMAFAGVVHGMMRGFDALSHCGISLDGELVLCGGGAHAATYRQLFADYTGKLALIPDADEATARGACVQAWNLLHDGRSLREAAKELRPAVRSATEPIDSAPAWLEMKERYLEVAAFACAYRPSFPGENEIPDVNSQEATNDDDER